MSRPTPTISSDPIRIKSQPDKTKEQPRDSAWVAHGEKEKEQGEEGVGEESFEINTPPKFTLTRPRPPSAPPPSTPQAQPCTSLAHSATRTTTTTTTMTMVTVTHECCTNHDADLRDLGASSSPPVSRGYEGEEGVLDEALVIALKNQRDRQFLLKLDRELCSFLMNKSQDRLELPWGNSYYRMMIHRSAIYFQLARKVEPLLKKIILSKTECSAIPTLRFSDLVEEEPDEEMDNQERQTNKAAVDESPVQPVVRVLKRCPTRPDSPYDVHTSSSSSLQGRRAMSIEQREHAYAEARARIFCEKDADRPSGCLEEEGEEEREGDEAAAIEVTQQLDGLGLGLGVRVARRLDSIPMASSPTPSSSSSSSSSSSGATSSTEMSTYSDKISPDLMNRYYQRYPPQQGTGGRPSLAAAVCDCKHEGVVPYISHNDSRRSAGYSAPYHHHHQQQGATHPPSHAHDTYYGHRYPICTRPNGPQCQGADMPQCTCKAAFGNANHPGQSHSRYSLQQQQQQQQYRGHGSHLGYQHHHHNGVSSQVVSGSPPSSRYGRPSSAASSSSKSSSSSLLSSSPSLTSLPSYQHSPPRYHKQQPFHSHHTQHSPSSSSLSSSLSSSSSPSSCCDAQLQGPIMLQDAASDYDQDRKQDHHHHHHQHQHHHDEHEHTPCRLHQQGPVLDGSDEYDGPRLFQVAVRPYPASTGYRPCRQAVSVSRQIPRHQRQRQQQQHQQQQQPRSQRPLTPQQRPLTPQQRPLTPQQRPLTPQQQQSAPLSQRQHLLYQTVHDVDRRPPQSTELYDPYATTSSHPSRT